MCLCRWQRDRRDALTWQGAERSPCRQGATRAAQGPDPGLCLPSPQVRPHVTDFADPLPVDVGALPQPLAVEAVDVPATATGRPEPSGRTQSIPSLSKLL